MVLDDRVPPPNDTPLDIGYLPCDTQIGFFKVETRLDARDFGAVYTVTRDGSRSRPERCRWRLSAEGPGARAGRAD
jgi:hypothetical protein